MTTDPDLQQQRREVADLLIEATQAYESARQTVEQCRRLGKLKHAETIEARMADVKAEIEVLSDRLLALAAACEAPEAKQ